jgi:hypothetical protein
LQVRFLHGPLKIALLMVLSSFASCVSTLAGMLLRDELIEKEHDGAVASRHFRFGRPDCA